MRPPKQCARDPTTMTTTELTDNLADAVIYLSRVALDVGLGTISTDLLSISSRLRNPSGEFMAAGDDIIAKFTAQTGKRRH